MKKILQKVLEKILKKLASLTLKRYKPGVIGITGNVGKTSAKEALRTILSKDRNIRAPSKNFNNEIGLPLTILGDWAETGGLFFWLKVIAASLIQLAVKNPRYPEILILEYGVDAPGDMKKLLDIIRPHIGIITAIGDYPVHVEFFPGREGIVREKTKLVNSLPSTGFAVLNMDDQTVFNMKNSTRARIITYGFSDAADIKISAFDSYLENNRAITSFKLHYNGSFVPIKLENVLGKSQAYACAAAAAAAIAFGTHLIKISENLQTYSAPAGRLKVIPGLKNTLIIDDTYNSAPLAMLEALDILKKLQSKRKIAVLGDMLELGKTTVTAHETVGKITAKTIKILFTVGRKAKIISESGVKAGLAKKNILSFQNLSEAALKLQEIIEPGDLILIKGSQGVRMEKIVKEIMLEPDKAGELLVRQNKRWLEKPGLYDNRP